MNVICKNLIIRIVSFRAGQRTSDKILRNSTRLLERISHEDQVDPKEIKVKMMDNMG